MTIDREKLIREKRRDLVAAVRAAREGRSLRDVAEEIGVAASTLSRDKLTQRRSVEKLAAWTRFPVVSGCAKELLELMGVPPHIVAAIGREPRADNVVKLDAFRLNPPKAPGRAAARPVFIHAALQMEATDFPPHSLAELLFNEPGADLESMAERAIADLVTVYADARYFGSFAQALQRGEPLPRHPFDTFRLHPFLYPEKVAAYNAAVKGTPIEQIYEAEQYVFTGRDVSDIFLDSGPAPADSWEARIEKMTAHAAPQEFASFDPGHRDTIITRITREAATENGQLYEALAYLADFVTCSWQAPEKTLLIAAACSGAMRAELAALCASTTFRLAWRENPVLSRSPLFRIASLIHVITHQTYLTAAEHWGKAFKDLPETDERQCITDRDTLGRQYRSTMDALSSDEGLWFHFRTNAKEALAYLSRNGSLLQDDVLPDEGGRVFHRYVMFDESLLPSGFVPGKDRYHAF